MTADEDISKLTNTLPAHIKRAMKNLQEVTDLQEENFEAIVEDTAYLDAINVINKIKELK